MNQPVQSGGASGGASPQPLIGILILATMVAYLRFAQSWGWDMMPKPCIDLPSFHVAATRVYVQGESAYSPLPAPAGLDPATRVFPFFYPPPALLLFRPLAWLPYITAKHLVVAGNHLAVLLVALAAFRATPGRLDARLAVAAASLLYLTAFHPLLVTIDHGQVNLAVMLCITAFWWLSRRGFPTLAGIGLALAVVLKTYPVLLIPAVFLAGRRREAVASVAGLLVMCGLSLLLVPATPWTDWFGRVAPYGGYMTEPPGLFSPASIWNQNINGFFARLLTENAWVTPLRHDPALALVLAQACAGLVVLASSAVLWRGRRGDWALENTLLTGLPAIHLIAPFSWEHHLVILLPAIWIIARMELDGSPAAKLLSVARWPVLVLLALPRCTEWKGAGVLALWCLAILASVLRHRACGNPQPPAASVASRPSRQPMVDS